MHIARTVRSCLLAAAACAVVLGPASTPAHAVSKEIIQLQTQVQQLLDMVQRLQSSFDTRFGVLQNLAQQTANEANQMSTTVNTLQQKLNTQGETVDGKVDGVSGQVQAVNDSVDELKARIAKLDKSVQDLQNQIQTMQSQQQAAPTGMQGMPGAAPAAVPGAGAGMSAAPGAGAMPGGIAQVQAPPLKDTYQAALRDFNAARYGVAAGEFQDVVHYYPLDDLAGTAQFYLGEIAYHQHHYEDAINSYNAVLEGFSGNAKAPTAQYHKGLALLALNRRESGIHELRALIQRYPRTPEAERARSKLNAMGVRLRER